MAKFLASWVFVLVWASVSAPLQADSPGVVEHQPESGRFVRYRGIYMVPYVMEVPRTGAKIQMLPVPPGTFILDAEDESGKPIRLKVAVKPFWMARTEVTWSQFEPYMELNFVFSEFARRGTRELSEGRQVDAVTAPSEFYDPKVRRDYFGGMPDHPVGGVAPFGARNYTKYLSKLTGQVYRLPSAVEWQYAARAQTDVQDKHGQTINDLNSVAWYRRNASRRQRVGLKGANAWGLHDMAGNVAEWVLDGDEAARSELVTRLTAERGVDSIQAVAWPTQHRGRMALGGAFDQGESRCQFDSAFYSTEALYELEPLVPPGPHWTNSDRGQAIGFRIVRPVDDRISSELKRRYWEPDHPEVQKALKIKLESGYAGEGWVDPGLPDAIESAKIKRRNRRE